MQPYALWQTFKSTVKTNAVSGLKNIRALRASIISSYGMRGWSAFMTALKAKANR